MISCLTYSPLGDMVAAGSYSSSIAIYDPRTWEMLFLLQGHKGGLTQLMFTHDGSFLISGSRQDPHLLCWDLRGGEAGELYQMERCTAKTNQVGFRTNLTNSNRKSKHDLGLNTLTSPPVCQRVQFDIDPSLGRYLATGGTDGHVLLFDLQTGKRVKSTRVAGDTVSGCSFHPTVNLLATASGHRRYNGGEIDKEEEAEELSRDENCLR